MTDQQTLDPPADAPASAADEPVDSPTDSPTDSAADDPTANSASSDAAEPVVAAGAGTPGTTSDPPAEAAVPPRRHRAVQVPIWLLVVVLGAVVVAGAFFVGRSTAPESSDPGPTTLAEAVEETASGEMEVGDFDARTLIEALSQNEDLDLGILGDLLLGGSRRG